MTQTLELASLQTIDQELAVLRSSAAEVERRLLGDEELVGAKVLLTAAKERLAALRKQQRSVERDLAALSERIATDEARLYGGTLKTGKEMTTLQHEVDGLKASRGEIEEGLLAVLADMEISSGEADGLKKEVASLDARWIAQSETLRGEATRLASETVRAEALRAAQVAKVDAGVLRMYEALRVRKSGAVIVTVKGNSCAGCRVGLPDAVRRKVATSLAPVQCPHCERILVLG